MMASSMTLEFLSQLPLFAGIPEHDLIRLNEMAEPVELDPGQVLMKEGDREDSLFVILEGECEVSKRSGEKEVVIALRGRGEVMGEMALLGETPRSATVKTNGIVKLLRLDKGSFQAVLRSSPEAALAILDTVTGRLRDTQSVLQHHEKLSALGTLAAGLAHEINNPAGAIQSAADQLNRLALELAKVSDHLAAAGSTRERRAELDRLRAGLAKYQHQNLGSLERSDQEQELETWLSKAGVAEAWEVVGPLVAAGWRASDLFRTAEIFPAGEVDSVVRWLAQASETLELIGEISQAARQISSIVESVKNYSYLDQAPEQVVDIHAGLEDTLVILRHKLREGIIVERDFAPDLPRVEGFGSELTQVWTNLVDNAIDALDGRGTLTLITRPVEDGVQVRICDDGPGIPDEHRNRIFEPFYTTKPPGSGTGLGLHMVYNIVVQRHKGSVDIESEPGRTCFIVTLPARR